MIYRIVPNIVTDKVEISRILGSPENEGGGKSRAAARSPSTTIAEERIDAHQADINPLGTRGGILTRGSGEWVMTQGYPLPKQQSQHSSPQLPTVPAKRHKATPHPKDRIKKQSKWSPEEDALITLLRGKGMKWEDISNRLPNRSPISCRLHYQNYLERRSEWDEDKKNKLARLYERFKADMWSKIAEEMAIPWRAAEAMHWQIGERGMAQRAGVTPFTFSHIPSEPPAKTRRTGHPPPRDSRQHPSATQLPSVAELTAGIPAIATQPSPEHPSTTSPPRLMLEADHNQDSARRNSRARSRRI